MSWKHCKIEKYGWPCLVDFFVWQWSMLHVMGPSQLRSASACFSLPRPSFSPWILNLWSVVDKWHNCFFKYCSFSLSTALYLPYRTTHICQHACLSYILSPKWCVVWKTGKRKKCWGFNSWTAWCLKMKAIWSFQTLGTAHPTTQCHVPENVNPQPQYYENLQFYIYIYKRAPLRGIVMRKL